MPVTVREWWTNQDRYHWNKIFAARSNIRRKLINTAGGKALLAAKPDAERDAYLRRQQSEDTEAVSEFLAEFAEIRKSGVSRNFRHHGAQIAFASVVRNQTGESVAAAILVGQTTEVEPREGPQDSAQARHFLDAAETHASRTDLVQPTHTPYGPVGTGEPVRMSGPPEFGRRAVR